MEEIYAVYLDVFFMQNFLIDGVCLLGVKILMRDRKRYGCLCLLLGTLAGTVLGTMAFLFLSDFLLYQAAIFFAVQPLTVFLALRPGHWKLFFKELACCYVLYLLMGGIMEFLLNYLEKKVVGILPWAVFLFAAVVLGVHLLEKRRQRFCRCTLLWSKEKKAIMRGMFDSGNGLREPYGKRPVSIISEEWKERMEIGQKDLRLIPYHTVSGEHELMEITTVPEMILEQEGQTRRYTSVAVGFAKGQVFAGKSYGMILHREYME